MKKHLGIKIDDLIQDSKMNEKLTEKSKQLNLKKNAYDDFLNKI